MHSFLNLFPCPTCYPFHTSGPCLPGPTILPPCPLRPRRVERRLSTVCAWSTLRLVSCLLRLTVDAGRRGPCARASDRHGVHDGRDRLCFFVVCNRHWFNRVLRSRSGSQRPGSWSLGCRQDRASREPPSRDRMCPFGIIGIATRYIPNKRPLGIGLNP